MGVCNVFSCVCSLYSPSPRLRWSVYVCFPDGESGSAAYRCGLPHPTTFHSSVDCGDGSELGYTSIELNDVINDVDIFTAVALQF